MHQIKVNRKNLITLLEFKLLLVFVSHIPRQVSSSIVLYKGTYVFKNILIK